MFVHRGSSLERESPQLGLEPRIAFYIKSTEERNYIVENIIFLANSSAEFLQYFQIFESYFVLHGSKFSRTSIAKFQHFQNQFIFVVFHLKLPLCHANLIVKLHTESQGTIICSIIVFMIILMNDNTFCKYDVYAIFELE